MMVLVQKRNVLIKCTSVWALFFLLRIANTFYKNSPLQAWIFLLQNYVGHNGNRKQLKNIRDRGTTAEHAYLTQQQQI